jgi:glucose/mannose-6-phosphate isomerase
MKEVLIDFPTQFEDAIKVTQDVKVPEVKNPANIVVCGMGGSAISGDLLAKYLADKVEIPVIVNRDYTAPAFVNENSIVFVSSYSGNTEETLSAYKEVCKRTKNIICITSGGKVERLNPPYIIKVPAGYQPRCASGWMFTPMLVVLEKMGIIKDITSELKETITTLKNLAPEFSKENSLPFSIAQKLLNKFPIIYSDSQFEPVAKRWATQLNENAKVLAHFNVFPELNHNEIVGFENPKIDSMLLILTDKSYNKRVVKRIEITSRILSQYTGIQEIASKGDSLLARMFYLVYLGDWASYWLAILRGIDPTPVERIQGLKKELEK